MDPIYPPSFPCMPPFAIPTPPPPCVRAPGTFAAFATGGAKLGPNKTGIPQPHYEFVFCGLGFERVSFLSAALLHSLIQSRQALAASSFASASPPGGNRLSSDRKGIFFFSPSFDFPLKVSRVFPLFPSREGVFRFVVGSSNLETRKKYTSPF